MGGTECCKASLFSFKRFMNRVKSVTSRTVSCTCACLMEERESNRKLSPRKTSESKQDTVEVLNSVTRLRWAGRVARMDVTYRGTVCCIQVTWC